ncbi:MAG TPA: hypothetical protein VKE23_06925 [Candidatus Limnocylindria bacterium]|nr:hypothetical protein [Candidatus Limnocylindria bacterium]
MNDVIDFYCARAEHQDSEPNDALTMHEDRWAYCAAGARDQHEWRAIPAGGLSLELVKQFVRRQPPLIHGTTEPRSD